jgi:hypothetical protein
MTRRTYDDATRETLARAILETPADIAHAVIGRRLDMNAEAVRRVRVGMMWASYASELPRIPVADIVRTCRSCRLFEERPYRRKTGGTERRFYGFCSLHLPEATDNHDWARSCEAYCCSEGGRP